MYAERLVTLYRSTKTLLEEKLLYGTSSFMGFDLIRFVGKNSEIHNNTES